MVDAHALGACGLGRAASNPASPTSSQRIQNRAVQFALANLRVSPTTTLERDTSSTCKSQVFTPILDAVGPLRYLF